MSGKIRIGFLIGKDNDAVEDPGYVGDTSFLEGLPRKYRVDPESNEYLKVVKRKSATGIVHADVAVPWWIHKNNPDIEIDLIFPEEISLPRLKRNLCNFIIGYDVINSVFEGPTRWAKVERAISQCGNMMPSWEVQDHIYYKSKYMKACIDAGIPVAPTIFCIKGDRSPERLLSEMKRRGWKSFVVKQSFSAFSLGFMLKTVKECEEDPKILKAYFKEYKDIPEYVVQEAVPGFVTNWETRCFWINGQFAYAIANKAAVSQADGQEVIITGKDIPKEFLEAAKKIGKKAIDTLPQMRSPSGHPIGMVMMRTDIGCSDTKLHDKDNHWPAGKRTFFLNEIESSGCNMFTRHMKFDVIPFWGKLWAEKAREVAKAEGLVPAKKEGTKRKSSASPGPRSAKRAATGVRLGS